MNYFFQYVTISIAIVSSSIGCKRDSVDEELLNRATASDLSPNIAKNESGDTQPIIPKTENLPVLQPEQTEDFADIGIEYSLAKGSQGVDCEQFKSFVKEGKNFRILHNALATISEDGNIAIKNLCGITAEMTVPKNYIINFEFASSPSAVQYLLNDGDAFSFTYEFSYFVDEYRYTKSYVGNLNEAGQSIKDVTLDARRVVEMICPTDPEELKKLAKDRNITFSLKLASLLRPKVNSMLEDKTAIGQILETPTVNIILKKCGR